MTSGWLTMCLFRKVSKGPQDQLCPSSAQKSRRPTHDGHGFVVPRVVPVGTRSPIDGVFQDAGHAVVVLRSHNQNGVRAAESLAAEVFMASEPKDSKPEPPPIRPIQDPAVVHDKVVTWQS